MKREKTLRNIHCGSGTWVNDISHCLILHRANDFTTQTISASAPKSVFLRRIRDRKIENRFRGSTTTNKKSAHLTAEKTIHPLESSPQVVTTGRCRTPRRFPPRGERQPAFRSPSTLWGPSAASHCDSILQVYMPGFWSRNFNTSKCNWWTILHTS